MKMICTKKAKTTIAATLLVLLALSLSAVFLSCRAAGEKADTEKSRMDFMKSLGINISDKTEHKKTVQIPLEFGAVYENYNRLQKTAGYDLSHYKGVKATLFSYPVADREEYRVNLLVYRGRIIGGDLSSVKLDGRMVALKKEEIEKCLK